MAKGGDKKPKIPEVKGLGAKIPRLNSPDIEGSPLAWRFSACDRAGDFAWPPVLSCERLIHVFEKIHEFEAKTWEQLVGMGCHQIDCWQLDKAARDRLKAIELDDIEQLMSFHVSGIERIWCIKDANIMRVLWWDPLHKVYPTKPDRADRAKDRRKSGR